MAFFVSDARLRLELKSKFTNHLLCIKFGIPEFRGFFYSILSECQACVKENLKESKLR